MNKIKTLSKFMMTAAAVATLAVAPAAAQKGGSTTTSPQEVRDVDAATRQPFSAICTFSIPSGAIQSSACLINVPAGKRLVVEHMTVTANMPPGAAQTPRFFLRGQAMQSAGATYLAAMANYVGGDQSNDQWMGSQSVKAIYNEGAVTARLERSNGLNALGGAASATMSVFGYFVDVQ